MPSIFEWSLGQWTTIVTSVREPGSALIGFLKSRAEQPLEIIIVLYMVEVEGKRKNVQQTNAPMTNMNRVHICLRAKNFEERLGLAEKVKRTDQHRVQPWSLFSRG